MTLEYEIAEAAVKSALLYSDATQVRWERTHTREQAADLYATHRRRLEE